MNEHVKSGRELLDEVDQTNGAAPALWWLGHSGFIVKSYDIVFYIDPFLSQRPERSYTAPLAADEVHNADLILCTHRGSSHMDPATLLALLDRSPRARVVLPKSTAEHANSIGVPYERMTTTDSDLRVEFFKRGLYGRVYCVPSAHPELDWTPLGGYPHLGYLLRFGGCTIYHSGDCRWYEGIVERLTPYRVTAALLPISGEHNFDHIEAAQLAKEIGAQWLVPMHYGTFRDEEAHLSRFIDHMLGFHPEIGFKVFQPGERWAIPE